MPRHRLLIRFMNSNNFHIKVLMTTDTVGGVWTYCMELCNHLPQVQFHLVTMGALPNAAQKRQVSALQNVVLYPSAYKLEWMENPWADIEASGLWLLQLEQDIEPDLIHLNAFSYGVLPFMAPKLVVAHSDVYSWWRAVKNEMPPAGWAEYYSRVKTGLHQANLVVAPSCTMLSELIEIYGRPKRVKEIYNGRSADVFFQTTKKPFVFSMGRVWDEAKNIQLLIDAAGEINFHIKIAGPQQFQNNQLIGGVKAVEYLGKLNAEAVAAVLSEASVYVLPAKYEPFGLSALEAAFSGCALVLSNIPSLKEIWEDAAVYVDTNDSNALATVVNNLLTNSELLHRMQQKAFSQAQLYTANASAAAYQSVYTELIASSIKSKSQFIA